MPYYKDDHLEKLIGYLPFIRFREDNNINQKPREDYLIDRISPYKSERKCWAYLAKELVYMLMRVKDLEGKFEERKY